MRAKPFLLFGGTCLLGVAAVWMLQDLAALPPPVARDAAPVAPLVHENTATPRIETPRLAGVAVKSLAADPPRDTAQEDPVGRDRQVLAKIDANLGEKLRGERVDAAWSRETESAIANAVADPGFAGLRLDAVRCGSTLCRVAITAGDEVDDVHALVEELTSTRPFRAGGFLRFTGDRAVTMFVTRAGTQLPPPPRS